MASKAEGMYTIAGKYQHKFAVPGSAGSLPLPRGSATCRVSLKNLEENYLWEK